MPSGSWQAGYMQSQSRLSRAVWSEHHEPIVIQYSTVWVERPNRGPGLKAPRGASGLKTGFLSPYILCRYHLVELRVHVLWAQITSPWQMPILEVTLSMQQTLQRAVCINVKACHASFKPLHRLTLHSTSSGDGCIPIPLHTWSSQTGWTQSHASQSHGAEHYCKADLYRSSTCST